MEYPTPQYGLKSKISLQSFIYILYLTVTITALSVSIVKFKNLFHPQTLIVIITIGLFMSDFLISGYSHRIIGNFSVPEIQLHQFTILHVCISIFLATYIIARCQRKTVNMNILSSDFSWSQSGIIPGAAFLIIAIDIFKRLAFADWSPINAFLLSIASRGSAPWNIAGGDYGNLGDANFIYSLTSILMPFCCLTMFCRFLISCGLKRTIAAVFFLVPLMIMVIDGTRAPVVFVIAMMCSLYYFKCNSTRKRIIAVAASVSVILALTSTMYLFRSHGYTDMPDRLGDLEFVYHQDDNYFQSINSLTIAEKSSERWDPVDFAIAVLVNPVPRYFWQNKPALLSDYWGSYKNEWTTITALGELTAMFGPVAGPVMTVFIAVSLYLLLRHIFISNNTSFGFIIYMSFALYAYAVMRSLLNISQFIYMPLFLLFISKIHYAMSRK